MDRALDIGRACHPLGEMLKPLDVIEFLVAVESWEAGTTATVLEIRDASVLAEVSDESGRTLEILAVPLDAVKRIDMTDQSRLEV
jgi:hypothetical protein